MWDALRNRWLNLVEVLLLGLITCSMLVPWPRRSSAGDVIRHSFKRMFDLVASSIGIVLALPILLLVPVLIKLDSPGPVFYRQTRVGLDRRRGARRVLSPRTQADRRSRERRRTDQSGQLFQVIKFRSMVQNAERNCGPVWASRNDPRITRLGRFLRRSRIDEIPQLFNVLAGQMSLVGPRPERPHFVTKFCDRIDKYPTRHRVKPGITGLAQVEHGYDTDEDDVLRKVEYDLHYIERWNPALDMRILLRTVRIVVSGRGAQ
jgi:lipopolysaccharide/colanic/teichoic acid biosynthesis glycosyltransferase